MDNRRASTALARGATEQICGASEDAPFEHRSESLSAAISQVLVRDQRDDAQGCVTPSCASHYGMTAGRNNRCESHENERRGRPARASQTRRWRTRLRLRGSRDFDTLDDYGAFVDEVVGRRNATTARASTSERCRAQAPDGVSAPSDFDHGPRAREAQAGGFILRRVYYVRALASRGQSVSMRSIR